MLNGKLMWDIRPVGIQQNIVLYRRSSRYYHVSKMPNGKLPWDSWPDGIQSIMYYLLDVGPHESFIRWNESFVFDRMNLTRLAEWIFLLILDTLHCFVLRYLCSCQRRRIMSILLLLLNYVVDWYNLYVSTYLQGLVMCKHECNKIKKIK